MSELQQFVLQWIALDVAAQLESALPEERSEVIALYAAPERHYHSLAHANQVLVLTRALVGSEGRQIASTEYAAMYAAIYHDVVYDPVRGDNEEQSATLAKRHLIRQGASLEMVSEVSRLILATRHSELQWENDWTGKVLCDADLSALGADPDTYAAYSMGIRREYAHVPDEAYRAGRTKVLQSFLRRERIFQTPLMQAECEATARVNLKAEIASLAQV